MWLKLNEWFLSSRSVKNKDNFYVAVLFPTKNVRGTWGSSRRVVFLISSTTHKEQASTSTLYFHSRSIDCNKILIYNINFNSNATETSR